MVFWIVFGVLRVLTFVLVVLMRADARSYIESQVKVIGEEHRSHVDTKRMKMFFALYCLMLLVILFGFFLYFFFLL